MKTVKVTPKFDGTRKEFMPTQVSPQELAAKIKLGNAVKKALVPDIEVKSAEILEKWPDDVNVRYKVAKDLAETLGWTVVTYRHTQKHMMLQFKKDDNLYKVNLYLTSLTITESITARSQGKRQNVIKNVTPIEFARLLRKLSKF